MYIADFATLQAFVERSKHESVIAVDTEFLREKTYYPRLCLIQIGTENEQVAIDPLKIDDLSPLRELFFNPAIMKVFHACSQDMEIIYQELGDIPVPIFDTQVAAAFLGYPLQLGYGALVDAYCGVQLTKSESLTDWSHRPLDDAQLDYALDDVRYLPQIYREMTQQLKERGREDWVAPELAHVLDPSTYTHVPENAYRRVKRISSLSRKQLSAARELAAWRERRAQELDVPRRWVLSDELLVEIAKRLPGTKHALEKIRGVDPLRDADKQSLLAAVERGISLPEDQWPKQDKRMRAPRELESVCDLMNALVRLVAEQEGVAATLLASRDDLMEFAQGNLERTPLGAGWRYDLVGTKLDKLLSGQMGLTVSDGRIEILA